MSIPQNVQDAVAAALRWHEVRDDPRVAYRLSYARLGNSGASFGFYQEDCHANPGALATLNAIMQSVGMPSDQRGRICATLRDPHRGNPLSDADLAAVNAAINSPAGRRLVDQADAETMEGLIGRLDRCIEAAGDNGSTIMPSALIGMALWINQSGPPTVMLKWLAGGGVMLGGRPVPQLPCGASVDEARFFGYYDMIPFVEQNGNQGPAMIAAIKIGMAVLCGVPRIATGVTLNVGVAAPTPICDDADDLNAAELVRDQQADAP